MVARSRAQLLRKIGKTRQNGVQLADYLSRNDARGVAVASAKWGPMHPVYVPEYHSDGTTGGYLRRFSCRVCIFASDLTSVRSITTTGRRSIWSANWRRKPDSR